MSVLNAHGCLSRPPGGKEHDVTGAAAGLLLLTDPPVPNLLTFLQYLRIKVDIFM